MRAIQLLLLFGLFTIYSCRKDDIITATKLTPYEINYPASFLEGTIYSAEIPPMVIPDDNPMTVQGVKLGRKLFYEKLLSADNSQACASCHLPSSGFTDTLQFSLGIDNIAGDRNSMPLFNLGWAKSYFWDGRSATLEEQALEPVINPVEMHNTWPDAVEALQATIEYPLLFMSAFGTSHIDSVLVAKALSQFERTLLSGNSPFDRYIRGEPTGYSEQENLKMWAGFILYGSEEGADCIHCHGGGILFTDNGFHNNGLDQTFLDSGLAAFTKKPYDLGKFKTPSLRNLLFTAPYMHDGRFETIEQVVEHYSTGVLNSPTISTSMHHVQDGGVNLTPDEKEKLVFFLKSLTDSSFITNPEFQDPN